MSIRRLMRYRARVSPPAPPVSPPVSSFTWAPTASLPPVLVTFTDSSTNTPTSWAWTFKNSGGTTIGTSASQNPSFNFTTEGCTATVIASNAGGAGSAFTRTVSGSSNMLTALPASAIGNEISMKPWDAMYLQRMEAAGEWHLFDGSSVPTLDTNGFPVSGGWSLVVAQSQGRGTANINPQGAWKVTATPRTSGTPGTWSLLYSAGATLTNYAYNAGTNTVTADLNVSGNELTIGIRSTEAITALRITRPGVATDTTQYLMAESLDHIKKFSVLRFFNAMGQNAEWGMRIPSWSAWPAPGRMIGEKGWGFPMKLFTEAHNASQSRTKMLWVDAPHLFNPSGTEGDYLAWLTYLKDNLPGTAGLLISGTNELWNSIYATLHYMVAQINGYTISAQGDTVVQMTRADRIRVTPAGRGNAWKAVTGASLAVGATSITIASGTPGAAGNIAVGDSFRFQGRNSNYTVTGGVADVASGGTLTFSPAFVDESGTLAAGATIEIETYTCFGRWWGLREARMWKIAKDLFGADWGTRVFGVCSAHFANPYWHQSLYLPFLQESAQVAEFGALTTYIHGIGSAPYPGLSYTTYSGCTDAADIVQKLANSSFGEDTPLTWIDNQCSIWNGIKATFGITHTLNYESGMDHQGYVPAPGGGFYVHPQMLAAMRLPAFTTNCNELMRIHRDRGSRLTVWLNAMGSSYSSSVSNSAWGSIDQQLATSVSEAWADTTGRKITAIRDHMLVTGQLPLV